MEVGARAGPDAVSALTGGSSGANDAAPAAVVRVSLDIDAGTIAGGVGRWTDAVRVDALVVEGRADATAAAAVARVGRGVDALIAAAGETRLALALRIRAGGARRANVAARAAVVRVTGKVAAPAPQSH